jgi:hypothetical protein
MLTPLLPPAAPETPRAAELADTVSDEPLGLRVLLPLPALEMVTCAPDPAALLPSPSAVSATTTATDDEEEAATGEETGACGGR